MPSNKMRMIEAYLQVGGHLQEGLDSRAFGDLRSALAAGPEDAGSLIDALERLKRASPEEYSQVVVPYVMREIEYIGDYAQDAAEPIVKEIMEAVDKRVTELLKRLMKGRERDSDDSYEAVLSDLESEKESDEGIVLGAIEDVLHDSGVLMMDPLLDLSYELQCMVLQYDDLESLAGDAVFHDPSYEVKRVKGFKGVAEFTLSEKIEERLRGLLER